MIKPLYLVSGLLDSGKTSVIKETLLNPNFNEGERTMIITFEEGESEYDTEFLITTNSFILYFDSFKDLTIEKMNELNKVYEFERIFIEVNGMEDELSFLKEQGLTADWELAQTLSVFDASKFKLQLKNLNQFIYNHIKSAEVCIFNRFIDDNDYLYIRNNIKAINPRVELIFEDINHKIVEFEDKTLFDLSKEVLNVEDHDYGLWYMDVSNNPMKYENHKIRLKMEFIEDLPQYEKALIMGRKAMVCCADDIESIGLTLIGVDKKNIIPNKFYEIEGIVHCIENEEGYKICLLYVNDIKETSSPSDKLVYFN